MFKYYFKNFSINLVNLFVSYNKFYLQVILLILYFKAHSRYKTLNFKSNQYIYDYKLPDNLDRRELMKLTKKRNRYAKNLYEIMRKLGTISKYYYKFHYVFYLVRLR